MYTHTGGFCVATALLPDVNVAGADRTPFLGIEATGDHGEDVEHDGVEDDVGVVDRADADVGARRRLHPGLGQVVETMHMMGPGDISAGQARGSGTAGKCQCLWLLRGGMIYSCEEYLKKRV